MIYRAYICIYIFWFVRFAAVAVTFIHLLKKGTRCAKQQQQSNNKRRRSKRKNHTRRNKNAAAAALCVCLSCAIIWRPCDRLRRSACVPCRVYECQNVQKVLLPKIQRQWMTNRVGKWGEGLIHRLSTASHNCCGGSISRAALARSSHVQRAFKRNSTEKKFLSWITNSPISESWSEWMGPYRRRSTENRAEFCPPSCVRVCLCARESTTLCA